MLDQLYIALTFLAAIGSGLIAGVFYAFSTFVMKALHRRPANEGMAAMQAINVDVLNPMFLGVFLGTALICISTTIGAVMRWSAPGAIWVLLGGVFYFVGTFLVTIVCNVPLNDALARVTADDPDAPKKWDDYVRRWTMWNHVRMAAAIVATAALIIALYRGI